MRCLANDSPSRKVSGWLGGDGMRVMRTAMRYAVAICATGMAVACQTPKPTPKQLSACQTLVATQASLNASAMFEAVAVCANEGRKEDANRFMMLGQIRGTTDMGILEPANADAMLAASELYSAIFYRYGGLGFEEVYRDPAAVERLAGDITAAELRLPPGYDPGWAYKATSKVDVYDTLIDNAKRRRIWQMRNMALKYQNDAWYEANEALGQLQRETGAFEQGTPAWAEMERLTAIMNAASAGIPEMPEPSYNVPYARMTEADPEVEAMVVASGFNGPAESGAEIFFTEADVRASWLGKALSDSQMAAMLAKVRFAEQVLVSYSFGERSNASSRIQLTHLIFQERFGSYSIGTRLGVIPDTCGQAEAASYPFIVGVIAARQGAYVGGSSTSNYPADCGPIETGEPSETP
jgi:hypothetical protein